MADSCCYQKSLHDYLILDNLENNSRDTVDKLIYEQNLSLARLRQTQLFLVKLHFMSPYFLPVMTQISFTSTAAKFTS